jgi:hypothetical protein
MHEGSWPDDLSLRAGRNGTGARLGHEVLSGFFGWRRRAVHLVHRYPFDGYSRIRIPIPDAAWRSDP